MSLWAELKRRNVVRVALAYVVSSWVIIEVSSQILDIFDAPETISKIIVALLALGLPIALVFAWAFEVTPEGIKRESDAEHESAASHHRAKRLDLLTIGMVVVAIALLAVDRFIGRPAPSTEPTTIAAEEPAAPTPLPTLAPAEPVTTQPADGEPVRDAAWAAQQMLEISRLKDAGKHLQAFELARQVAAILPEVNEQSSFWEVFSWVNDIDSVPSGAKVWRQNQDVPEDEWEFAGETPLKAVRFAWTGATRVRVELEGYHDVFLLAEALSGPSTFKGQNARNPVVMDFVDSVPADMVRMPGFTQDLVEYDDYFMSRTEVTNREFAKFINDGGYDNAQYWTEPFTRDGQEVPFEDAMAEFVDRTGRPGPATWSGGAWPDGQGDFPVGGISWFEAVAFANYSDRSLPTVAQHEQGLRFYEINGSALARRSNFGDGPRAVGVGRAMSTMGLLDQVGNVREWCWNQLPNGTRCSYGAAWSDLPYRARTVSWESPWSRIPQHGLRLAITTDSEDKIARLREPLKVRVRRNYDEETPASDAEFALIKRFYEYDPLPLNAEIEDSVEFELWRRERVAFDLPSGERGAAYLFIPHNLKQPIETILFWPGSDFLNRASIDDADMTYSDFLVKSGRVLVLPVFKGILDRDTRDNPITSGNRWGEYETAANTYFRDLKVTWVKELSRTIDYLETRPDIYSGQLGYFGVSFGGFEAPEPLAIESDRIDTAVLAVAGLARGEYLPEVDGFNFIGRVTMPVLMINGEFDTVAPLQTSGQPMFDHLGTPPEHKKMHLEPTSHILPGDVLVGETLDWFDQYLRDTD